jgi:hypothetical protein
VSCGRIKLRHGFSLRAIDGGALWEKRPVLKPLEQLPEEATLEDIQYHLYVLQKIKAGQGAVNAGQVIPHDDVMRELAGGLV